MILLIDNYDSFVYNLARYVKELGQEYLVLRNDEITVAQIKKQTCILILKEEERNEWRKEWRKGRTDGMKEGRNFGLTWARLELTWGDSVFSQYPNMSVDASTSIAMSSVPPSAGARYAALGLTWAHLDLPSRAWVNLIESVS